MALDSKTLYDALVAAGVFKANDPIQRFVIDARRGSNVRMFVQRVGDAELATVLPQELIKLDSGDIFSHATPASAAEQIGEPETERQSRERDAAGRDPDYVRRRDEGLNEPALTTPDED